MKDEYGIPLPADQTISIIASKKPEMITDMVIKGAELYGITDSELAKIIRVKKSTISKMRSKKVVLIKKEKSFRYSIDFLQFFCYVEGVTFGDKNVAKQWIRSPNKKFKPTPLDALQESPERLFELGCYVRAEPGW